MTSKSKKLPRYEKPPVNEVACGLFFERLSNFRGHHIGLLWQKLKKDFPKCEHAMRIGFKAPESINMNDYLPRMWFINAERNKLIQLQDDCFFFNWRRGRQDEEYPRYRAIMRGFKSNFSKFQKFLEEERLGSIIPRECELTYINTIGNKAVTETLKDHIFRDFCWNSTDKRFLPDPIALRWQVAFPFPGNKGNLNVTLHTKNREVDTKPVNVLQLTARGLGESRTIDMAWKWFAMAHEWIVRGFTDLTTEAAHEKWGRIQ